MKKFSLLLAASMLAGCATLSATSLPLLNGDCPEGFSVKGNNGNNGWIYHTNKSPYYNRVNPEWCFKSEEAANQFGYRKFKTRKSYGH